MKTILFFLIATPFLASSQVYSIDELLGRFEPSSHPDFILVEKLYAEKENTYLRKEVYASFKEMFGAAKHDGLTLRIVSGTRNFNRQKAIWEQKWSKGKYKNWSAADKARDIMRYSAMPGTSRHHWGTDMDFNSLEPSWFRSGEGKKIVEWLTVHGSEFGFYQTYTSKVNGRTGYEEEAWHWTYLPLSGKMLDAYNRQIRLQDINGFKGYEAAAEIRVIEDYVNGLNAAIK